jgi:hypothetical protein
LLINLQYAAAADDAEGQKISVPADKPLFTIELPDGWKCTEPVTPDSILSWSGDAALTGQFAKLGEFSDGAAAKKKALEEAQIFLTMSGDSKASAPTAKEEEIAGHPGWVITGKYNSSGKANVLQLVAFTADGKNYNEVVVQCPESTMPADDIEEMVGSIAAK